MKTIAVVPARMGSKRINKKNIKDLNGKPLVCYTVEAALKSGSVDHIYVSTDIVSMNEILRNYECDRLSIVWRDKSIAGDNVTTETVLIDILKKYDPDEEVQGVVTLSPSSPFRTPSVVDDCIDMFYKENADTVFTISSIKIRAGRWDKLSHRFYLEEEYACPEMFNIEPKYYDNSSVYVTKPDVLFEKKFVMGEKNYGILIDRISGFDINEPEDWYLAELIAEKR
jgi:CMP-N-acetylneuraminic acid synthetase